MEIVQLSSQQDFPCHGLRLSFDEALCSFASIHPHEVNDGQGLHFRVTAVAQSGIVYVVKIPVSKDLWSNFVLPNSNLFVRDFSSDFARLQHVTEFAATANMLFAGGQNGSVLCIGLFTDPGSISYELKGGDAGLSRLWGLVSRQKNVGEVRSLAVEETGTKTVLFVLYGEGILQAWDPFHHVRLFSDNICSLPQLTGSLSVKMWLEEGAFTSSKQIAILFVRPDTNEQALCIYSLDALPSGGIQLGPPVPISVGRGKIVDVKLLEGDLWVLKDSEATTFVLTCTKTQLDVLPQPYRLQEEEIHRRLIYDESLFISDFLSTISVEGDSLLPKMFLRKILEPGVFHHETLQEVLGARGVYVNNADFRTLSVADWEKKIIQAVNSEVTGNQLSHWNQFANQYLSTWKQKNIPRTLFSDLRTGCMGLVRKSSLSLFRLQSGIEKTSSRAHSSNNQDTIDSILKCTQDICRHIGKLPLAIFHECLLHPAGHSLDHLVTSYLQILDVGFQSTHQRDSHNVGVDELRQKERELHLEQRKFNFRISSAVRDITRKAGNWNGVIDSILVYAKSILECTHFSPQKSSSRIPDKGSAFTKIITKATSQVLYAQFEAARDLIFLLSFFLNAKGQIDLTSNEASKIQQNVLPQLKKAMVINLVLHLLSVTSGEASSSDDFSFLLSSLRIDGSNNGTIWTASGHFTMLEILASSAPIVFTQNTGALVDRGDVLDLTRAFITWLLMGQDSKRPQFSHRIIELSSILLQQRQYRGLEEFLCVAEKFSNERHLLDTINTDGESTARLYLLGLCVLAHACSGLEGALKTQKITEATSYFFRAAAGLGEASNNTFKPLLSNSASLPKLHYFEKVMQIFEQYNLSEGAMEFALAALDQIDDGNENSNSLKGRLWANVFKFAMDLGLYGDAYCAIISDPDLESKHTCLRRFVVVLCERKATKILCGGELPYAGLLDIVEQELAWKAEYSDISTNPNPYKLLYAFHIQRHNYRKSAGYIYRYSTRMKNEGVSRSRLQISTALQEHVNGLAAAINALRLVNPTYAWLDGEFTGFDEHVSSSPSKRSRPSEEIQASVDKVSEEELHVVDIEEMKKQYAIAVAKLELVKANVNHPKMGSLSPVEVVQLLVHSGLYEVAFSLVFKFWKDSLLKSELEKIFGMMARQCCTPVSIRPNQKLLLSAAFVEENICGGSKANWQALQSNLEKYRKFHPHLPVVVAEAILSTNKNMELPLWLIDMFKGGRCASSLGMAGEEGDPAALMRIYLNNGRLVEAAFLLLDYLKAAANMRAGEVVKRKRMCAMWFPYTSIIRLKALLSECSEKDSQIEEVEKCLNAAVKFHLDQMKSDAQDLSSLQTS